MVDYWSNFFEVVEIHRKTVQSVITQLKVQLACHGILEVLIIDNGSEFDNQKFKNFSSLESLVQDIHSEMEKWKMPWKPAKDFLWKPNKTRQTHY